MTAFRNLSRLLIVAGVLLVSGCATTKLLSVWKDPEYAGTPRNIMIIGVMANKGFAQEFEAEFARQLKARGIGAVASSAVLPADVKLDKDVIAAKMQEIGADTVIITRVIEKREIASAPASPAFQRQVQWYGFYTISYDNLQSMMAGTQTNVYDLKTERLIWTAVSETWIEGSEDNRFLARTFVPVAVKRLVEDRVIK